MTKRCNQFVPAVSLLFATALAASAGVDFYTGSSRINVSDGLLTFSDITENGRNLRNYIDQDLLVSVQGLSYVFTPCGMNNENVYYPTGGGGSRTSITRLDGRHFDILETQISHGLNECEIYLWITAYDGQNVVGEWDADLPGGTLIGLEGSFDKVEVSAYRTALLRDEHNAGLLNYLALDNMEYGRGSGGGYTLSLTGQCPGPVTVAWSGAQPGSQQGLLIGQSLGTFTIPPNSPCGGTMLGIQGSISLVDPPGIFSTGTGSGQFSGNAGSGACGRYLQLVHGGSCITSNTVQIQ